VRPKQDWNLLPMPGNAFAKVSDIVVERTHAILQPGVFDEVRIDVLHRTTADAAKIVADGRDGAGTLKNLGHLCGWAG
jgi:hypothetical protein